MSTGNDPLGRRNVLLIIADQLRADALSCYGQPLGRTPTLDRLASQGVRFARHFSVSAPCGPARASLLTGLYQSTHGVWNNSTPMGGPWPTIARPLAEAGIGAYLVGYTDTVSAVDGLETVPSGFEWHTRFNLNETGLEQWRDHLAAHGHPVPRDPMLLLRPVPGTRNLATYPAALSDTAFVADRTIACMTEHRDAPWLIVSTFLRPHPPWVAPAPYHRLYEPTQTAPPYRAAIRAQEARRHPFLRYWLGRDTLDTAEAELTDEAVARHRATYLGLVRELDHHLGRLMATLYRLGRENDTLVVFTADHGDALGDHWSLGTGGFRSTAYHVPLIIRAPGRERPGTVTAPTESVDVAATILDWVGADPLPDSPGRSLLAGKASADPPPGAVYEFDFRDAHDGEAGRELGLRPEDCRLAGLRTERFHYVRFTSLPPMLFDYLADPGERVDLAGRPEYRKIVDDTARLLRDRVGPAS